MPGKTKWLFTIRLDYTNGASEVVGVGAFNSFDAIRKAAQSAKDRARVGKVDLRLSSAVITASEPYTAVEE